MRARLPAMWWAGAVGRQWPTLRARNLHDEPGVDRALARAVRWCFCVPHVHASQFHGSFGSRRFCLQRPSEAFGLASRLALRCTFWVPEHGTVHQEHLSPPHRYRRSKLYRAPRSVPYTGALGVLHLPLAAVFAARDCSDSVTIEEIRRLMQQQQAGLVTSTRDELVCLRTSVAELRSEFPDLVSQGMQKSEEKHAPKGKVPKGPKVQDISRIGMGNQASRPTSPTPFAAGSQSSRPRQTCSASTLAPAQQVDAMHLILIHVPEPVKCTTVRKWMDSVAYRVAADFSPARMVFVPYPSTTTSARASTRPRTLWKLRRPLTSSSSCTCLGVGPHKRSVLFVVDRSPVGVVGADCTSYYKCASERILTSMAMLRQVHRTREAVIEMQ